jgi:glycosyltransferase involved in cell wall biosynthesis
MKSIKELTVYTNGPSNEYRTWSNVPYFLCEALRANGVNVNQVDINPYPIIETIYNRTLRLGWKLFHRNTTYTYFRSSMRHMIATTHIRRAIRSYPNSQADIFLTYSFSPGKQSGRPVVLLSDRPYSYSIEYFRGRSPDLLEARSIVREDRHIEQADLVVTLFQSSVDIMKRKYQNENIFCLGQAINAPSVGESSTLPEIKARAFNLFFIGDAKYTEGLRVLLLAYELLKDSYPELTLTIVGHDTSYLEPLPDGVNSYGYLDKGQEATRDLLFALFKQARIYVNTTPKWAGCSSILEALVCYTPVVVAPFQEIVRMFGKDNDFILYCEENTPELLVERLRLLLDHPDYSTLARKAHAAVEKMTWNNYVSRLLELIESTL